MNSCFHFPGSLKFLQFLFILLCIGFCIGFSQLFPDYLHLLPKQVIFLVFIHMFLHFFLEITL